jgi:hypothetical protein
VTVNDKNETYNNLRLNGPSLIDPPKRSKKKDEDKKSGDEESDDEVKNAVYQRSDTISLSIYDE